MDIFEAVKQAVWLKGLLNNIHFKILKPINIYEGNNGCISLANKSSNHTLFHRQSTCRCIYKRLKFNLERKFCSLTIIKCVGGANV